jgi:hypothetical protein
MCVLHTCTESQQVCSSRLKSAGLPTVKLGAWYTKARADVGLNLDDREVTTNTNTAGFEAQDRQD